jgi:hypothetical protein
MDKVNYMNKIPLTLDALGIDLENSKYTFKENKALINQLPLEFDGFIQLVDAGQQYDLKFKTPTSSFKNFLGIIPAAYASSLDNVKTTGDFIIAGFAKVCILTPRFLNLMLILNQIMLPSNILIYLNQSKILLLTLKSSTNFK